MSPSTLFEDPVTGPVAKVAIDVPLAHLDQLFDYRIPESMATQATPGVRVVVRFGGQLVEGWLVDIGERESTAPLRDIKAVVSPEIIVTPQLNRLIRSVADHYAGTWWDVARLAIPPRVARVENQTQAIWPIPHEGPPPAVLPAFPGGAELLTALQSGASPRAFWQVPCHFGGIGNLAQGLIEAIAATLASDRSVMVLVPTLRGLEHIAASCERIFGDGVVATLTADRGRSHRYEHYLACLRGQARIMVGTQSAVFSPMHNLGLIAVVDDGHPAHGFERFPRPHVRVVATMRAAHQGCAVLFASHARSCETELLVSQDWLRPLELAPTVMRRLGPPVRVVGERDSRRGEGARLRLPSQAFDQIRAALASGPVLVAVMRAGYATGLQCNRCRRRASCAKCGGPLTQPSRDRIECLLCGFLPRRFECTFCHAQHLRAPLVGSERTAEELGRAFPGVRVVNSSAERIRSEITGTALVVATPGGEPRATDGYAAALILDTEAHLHRADLRASEETMRRWSHVVSLVRPAADGGTVLIVGDSAEPTIQALVRFDPAGFAARELADRQAAGLPPAVKAVIVSGDPQAVAEFLDNSPFEGAELLGPTTRREEPDPEAVALLRAPLDQGRGLVRQVKAAAAIRSARKEGGKVFIDVDPTMDS